MMRIAESIGGRTVEELAEVLSVEEFAGWVDEFLERNREETEAMEKARR